MQSIRIYDMPPCRMASSGVGMFGQDKFDRFGEWLSAQPRSMFPRDFLYWAGEGFCWLYMLDESTTVPEEFDGSDFPGGLYAVATDIDQQTDTYALNTAVDEFLAANGLERDPERASLGNIITSPQVREILGYEQMDYYTPVRAKSTQK